MTTVQALVLIVGTLVIASAIYIKALWPKDENRILMDDPHARDFDCD